MPQESPEQRRAPREELEIPCRVWHPRALRFLAGSTRNLSRDGALVSLRAAAPIEPGERVRIGLPARAGEVLVTAGDFLEGTVLRSETEDGRILLAVTFSGAMRDAAARRADDAQSPAT